MKESGYKFTIYPSNADENSDEKNPHKYTMLLSERKAEVVAAKYPDSIVIAADTMVFARNRLLGKPVDYNQAFEMLSFLSGRKHLVITGFTIYCDNKFISGSEEASITLRKLSKNEIISLINTTNPYDKAGAYSLEDLPEDFVVKVDGELSTILGLPMHKISKHLEEIGKQH